MRKVRFTMAMLLIVMFFPAFAWSDEENRLTRDEVTVIKKKLVAILSSLGDAPKGYVKEDEDFNLPTQFYKNRDSGKINPIHVSATQRFGGGAEKKAKKSEKEMGEYYRKKMLEAQAKGDMNEMMRLTQEMQMKASQAGLEQMEAEKKEPVEIRVNFNSNPSQTIDPDNLVFEKPGVIALKLKGYDEGKATVEVYFDPVSLKDTKTLSVVDLKMPKEGVDKKTTVLNATITLSGPASEVEAWAKKIDTKAVLSQIDAVR
ncbi:MAG TPA: hypothetical protein VJ202_04165 [Thermodesulfobacteriota bacterium]|nr:hypothetical protein [Thermodesulfobacteriota bacterium]